MPFSLTMGATMRTKFGVLLAAAMAMSAGCQASNIFGTHAGTIGGTGGGGAALTVTPTATSVAVGASTTLTANQTNVEWASLDPTIASVSSGGTVTGLSVGAATIRVRLLSDSTQQATATVTVTQSVTGSPLP